MDGSRVQSPSSARASCTAFKPTPPEAERGYNVADLCPTATANLKTRGALHNRRRAGHPIVAIPIVRLALARWRMRSRGRR
jgi:hypothetical protein